MAVVRYLIIGLDVIAMGIWIIRARRKGMGRSRSLLMLPLLVNVLCFTLVANWHLLTAQQLNFWSSIVRVHALIVYIVLGISEE